MKPGGNCQEASCSTLTALAIKAVSSTTCEDGKENSDWDTIQAYLSDTLEQQLLDEGPFHSSFSASELFESPSTEKKFEAAPLTHGKCEAECDVSTVNAALVRASFSGKLNVVKAALRQGAHLGFRDTRGRTALHYAVFGDSLLVVKYLVERILALQEDVMKENCPPVALSDPQDKGNNLLDAPVNCYTEETFSLINQRDMRGWTPLHIAVCRDLVEITEYLLQQGADSSMLLSHNSAPCRETPTHSRVIHFCAIRSNSAILRVLLRCGVDASDPDLSGRAALHYAAARGNLAFTKELLEAAPNALNVLDCHSRSPLHVAALKGHTDIVQLFVNRGAEHLRFKDTWDLEPYRLAMVGRRLDTAQVILDAIRHRETVTERNTTSTHLTTVSTLHGHLALTSGELWMLDFLAFNLDKEKNLDQLARCVRRLGFSACLKKLAEVVSLQEKGGMLIADGTRRKTAGGVFFHLIRDDVREGKLSPEDWTYITAVTRERERAARSLQRRRQPLSHA